MNQKLKPNFTQIPNYFLDELMHELKESELRCLLVISRKTYGFHKDIDKIANSQFEKFTGMTGTGVRSGIRGLLKKKVIIQHGKGDGREISSYEINIESRGNPKAPLGSSTIESRGNPKAPTKEILQNKSTKENTAAKPPPFPHFHKIFKIFIIGYPELYENQILNLEGKKANRIGGEIKDLIKTASFHFKDESDIDIKNDKILAEIKRRARIFFKHIKIENKKFTKFDFMPCNLNLLWNSLAVEQIGKVKKAENEINKQLNDIL